MNKSIFFHKLLTHLIIILCGFSTLSAQNIIRKGSLGVGLYVNLPDSISVKYPLANIQGALVQFVVPNTTAEMVKIQPFDLITSVNEKAINNTPELLALAKELRANDNIEVKIVRKEQQMTLKGIVKPRPFDRMNNAESEYHEFAFDKGWVRSILFKPKGVDNPPVVYFIQGYACSSMDNIPANNPTKVLWQGMIDKGMAVYVVEKSGLGDNMNTRPCEDIGFNEEVAVFKKGYEKLLTLRGINIKEIHILGHSLGGVIAPLVANAYQPKGVAVYGTVLKPWGKYMLEVNQIQLMRAGESKEENDKRIVRYTPIFNKIFQQGKTPDEVKYDPNAIEALHEGLKWDGGNRFFDRHYTIMTEMDKHNLYDEWAKVKAKVLVLYGEEDEAAMYPDGHIEIADIVNKNHKGQAQYITFPKTNHSMCLTTYTDKMVMNMDIIDKMQEWVFH